MKEFRNEFVFLSSDLELEQNEYEHNKNFMCFSRKFNRRTSERVRNKSW